MIDGKVDKKMNVLKLAPFTLQQITRDDWPYSFTRQQAGYPTPWLKEIGKVFPYVGRVDNVYGDKNLYCSCPPVSSFFVTESSSYKEGETEN